MKRRYGIYYYFGIEKVLVMCKICERYCVPVIEMDDMREHLITNHPESCHYCELKHFGDRCNELFINHKEMRIHKSMIRKIEAMKE